MMQNPEQFYAAISAYGSWVAVGCALLIVWLQNRSAKRLLSLQLFVQIAAQYESGDMQRVRARLADRLLADSKTLELDDNLLVHYENVAILYRRGLVDRTLIWNIYCHDIPRYWEAVRHYVVFSRKEASDPSLYEEFEMLEKSFRGVKCSALGTPITYRELTSENIHEFLSKESLRSLWGQQRS